MYELFPMTFALQKHLHNDDIIYHYTKASTAIDFILPNNQLKFGARHNSLDPIESFKARRAIRLTGSNVSKTPTKKYMLNANNLINQMEEMEADFSQICFCKNEMTAVTDARNEYRTEFTRYEEIFGFTKPRMWERYADNYTGVCIAFSKKKLININIGKFDLFSDDVQYLNYHELSLRKLPDLDGDYLYRVGYKKYFEQIQQDTINAIFCKHIDYASENEFRLGIFYNKEYCIPEEIRGNLELSKTMMLEITNCVETIFVSSFANENQKRCLLDYANRQNVPIIELQWTNKGIKPLDYKGWINFSNEL